MFLEARRLNLESKLPPVFASPEFPLISVFSSFLHYSLLVHYDFIICLGIFVTVLFFIAALRKRGAVAFHRQFHLREYWRLLLISKSALVVATETAEKRKASEP